MCRSRKETDESSSISDSDAMAHPSAVSAASIVARHTLPMTTSLLSETANRYVKSMADLVLVGEMWPGPHPRPRPAAPRSDQLTADTMDYSLKSNPRPQLFALAAKNFLKFVFFQRVAPEYPLWTRLRHTQACLRGHHVLCTDVWLACTSAAVDNALLYRQTCVP